MSSSLIIYGDITECSASSRTKHKHITQRNYNYTLNYNWAKFLTCLRIYEIREWEKIGVLKSYLREKHITCMLYCKIFLLQKIMIVNW
jgi:hypothetical protein